MHSLGSILHALQTASSPRVLATLVRVRGTSYRLPGARMVLGPDGALAGSVSGGCLETDLALRAKDVLAAGRPCLVTYELGSEMDLVWGTGMGCTGDADLLLEPLAPGQAPPWMAGVVEALEGRREARVALSLAPGTLGTILDSEALPEGEEVFREVFRPPFALWIFGAGEPARPLADFASRLGWQVGVLDHRPALVTPARFPGATQLLAGRPGELIGRLALDARTAAIVMSHIFEPDKEALAAFLARGAAYVGLQGSRGRSAKLLKELHEERGSLDRSRLYWPMGLDVGAESPEAIAVAVLAEIHGVLSGHACGHLRDRSGPVHLDRP